MAAADLSLLDFMIERRFRLPDPLWGRIRRLLPRHRPGPLGGRPRADDRRCMEAILYTLITGNQGHALPRCYGPATTAHDRVQEWTGAKVFERLWERALIHYGREIGLRWTRQSMDGATTKAPFGGECTGPTLLIVRSVGSSAASRRTGRGSPSVSGWPRRIGTTSSWSTRPSTVDPSFRRSRPPSTCVSTRGTTTPRLGRCSMPTCSWPTSAPEARRRRRWSGIASAGPVGRSSSALTRG